MGLIVASAFVAKLRLDLVDEDATTWTDADLLEDLNEALRALCELKVDSYVIREPVALEAGTFQTLPVNGIAVVDITENTTSKRRVTLVDAELLDETSRFWPAGTAAADVQHWVSDPRDKTRFRVYPPNDGTGSVWTTYGAVPDPLEAGDTLPVSDSNEPALFAYALGAAYRRNTQRQDLAKTAAATQRFLSMLGLSAQTQIAAAPRVSQSPGAT